MTDTWYTQLGSSRRWNFGERYEEVNKRGVEWTCDQLHEEGDGTFYVENDNEVTLELCFSTRIVYDYFPPVILNTLH